MVENFPNMVKKYKPTDLRSSVSPKQEKHEVIKLFKTSDNEKILKATRKKRHVMYRES